LKYFAISGRAKDAEEAIILCAMALKNGGCVTDSFARDCIEREHEYPTGIPSEVPVAIPHCFSDSILEDGICYLRLEESVTFMRMDDDQKPVETKHVFSLAFSRGNHLGLLSALIKQLQSREFFETFDGLEIEEVPALLEKGLG